MAAAAADSRDEFGAVSGAIVEVKHDRYRCTATDVYSGGQKVKTVLRYPDEAIELTWQPNNRVGLQRQPSALESVAGLALSGLAAAEAEARA